MFLKNGNISSKIKRSKVTDYAALIIYKINFEKRDDHQIAKLEILLMISPLKENQCAVASYSGDIPSREMVEIMCCKA